MINLQPSELVSMLGVDTSRAQVLLDVSSQVIRDYVNENDVPVTLLNESVLRYAKWLKGSDASGISTESAGPLRVKYDNRLRDGLQASGAAALLSQYKVHRMAVST